MGTGVCFLGGVEPPKFDAKHISLSDAEVKNIWNFNSLPYVCVGCFLFIPMKIT
jgi:hypothetical protein